MEKILGQHRAVTTLQGALDSGRVHHAWIFHGPFGVGKMTAAREFARILLDPEAQPDLSGHLRADPASRIGQLVDDETHPDLHIITKELARYSDDKKLREKKQRNIPIDVLREHMIGDAGEHGPIVYHTPRLNHGKVFIIDEAELLDQVGQNAILKTLEEPPPRTYIILVTTQVDRLLPTIRSRCQSVAFTPLEAADMEAWLRANELNVTGDEREWIVRFAHGAPGLAMTAARDGMYNWARDLAPALRTIERGGYPPNLATTLAELVDQYATNYVKRHKLASKEMANQEGARRVFLILAMTLREGLSRAAATGDADVWLKRIDDLHEAEASLRANVNIKMVFANLVAQWSDVATVGAGA